MAYSYPAMVAWNPGTNTVVKNTVFQVYAPTDTTYTTPLAITDNQGNTLGNLNSGAQGVFPNFRQAQYATVVVSDVNTHTYNWTVPCSQLNPVTPWAANTYYTAGQPVVNPSGDVVSANVNHTSTGSYDSNKWTLSPTFAPATVNGNGVVRANSLLINVKDYGAVADGVTDDGPAIRSALSAAQGKTLFFPAGTYYYKATGTLYPNANTTIVGVRGSTVISFDVTTAGTYTEFIRNNGNSVTVEGLTINRVSDFPCVMFPWQAYAGFTIRNCVLNGNEQTYNTNYCHGIQTGVQNAGTSSQLLVTGTTFQNLTYGLFQTNASTATVTGMTFRDCLFMNNYATDLEFNSPNGTTNGVLVDNCTFQNNQTNSAGAGFGVGFAYIHKATVSNCLFTSYKAEAIHIEDYSDKINIQDNKFVSCALSYDSYIQVISGAQVVNISNNHFDASANTNFPAVINCLAGGSGNTPGGRTTIAPNNLTITGNHIYAGGLNGIYLESVLRAVVTNNRVVGAGSYNTGTKAYGGANGGWGIDIYDGNAITVVGNEILGFYQAFKAHTNSISTGGTGFTITGNNVSACGYGIALVNTGSGVVSGNIIWNCERPMITGTGNLAAQPVVVTGNHSFNCTFKNEVNGVVLVRSNGTATVGSGVTLTIQSLALTLPSGTAMTFTNGGVLTLTAAASAGATSLTGNLTTANIASGETAYVTGLAHSTVSGQNHITVSGNGDSVAGTY